MKKGKVFDADLISYFHVLGMFNIFTARITSLHFPQNNKWFVGLQQQLNGKSKRHSPLHFKAEASHWPQIWPLIGLC